MGYQQQKQQLLATCTELLAENKVELIIGFTAGEGIPMSVPHFMRETKDLEQLEWNERCVPNLAKYVLEYQRNVGIVAKPCDARAITMYLVEKQLKRDDIYIIGMECAGMQKNGAVLPACVQCQMKTPPIYDVLIKGEDGEVQDATPEIAVTQEQDLDKLARFQGELEKCILCFSCRQGCYGCYCQTCFIDRSVPNWQATNPDMGTKMMFHLGRAMHLAGRCVECGACENVCPSGVNIRYLAQELADSCVDLYDYRAGMHPEETPALATYMPTDREVGFLGGDDSEACCDAKKQAK